MVLLAVPISNLNVNINASPGALALKIAGDPALLDAIKTRLSDNRLTAPLFDTVRSVRDIESASRAMLERQRKGLPPATFTVESRA